MTCEEPQHGSDPRIGHLDRRLPVEPADLLALARWRRRVGTATVEQISGVEVGVTTTAGVHVDVDQRRNAIGIDRSGERDVQTGLLGRFTQRCFPRSLTGVDVTTRLQPQAEALVFQQQDPPRSHHDRRTRHVNRVQVLVERILEPVHLGQERVDRGSLTVVERRACGDVGTQPSEDGCRGHRTFVALA